MQINPGGRLDIKDVIGRDHEIDRYWRVLDRQGLVLSAERRIGKTHILLKMRDECQPVLLADAIDALVDVADGDRILMLWDEFPLMLHNLQRAGASDIAIRLLDHLRALRLANARVRFLFTGSIGLHLVLRSLREAGSANDPVNDMLSLTVPPIADADTTRLAAELLAETRALPPDIPALATRIAKEVGGFPYYVHHAVDQLDQLRRPPTLDDVSKAVASLVNDPRDPANLRYYLNRLSRYYATEQRSLALLALDMIAQQSSPVVVPDLLNLCRHREPSIDDEVFRDVLALLAADHYIEPRKSPDAVAYDFRWRLVKRWWKRTRS